MSEKFIRETPVIVGVGEVVDRPSDPQLGKEPLALMAEALRRADDDAGGGFLQRLGSLDVINSITWGYASLPAQLCQILEIHPERAAYGAIGGDTPMRYIHEAALRIARGEVDFAAICGAEATQSLLDAKKANIELPWTIGGGKPEKPRREGVIHSVAIRNGLSKPLVVYPIYEYANRYAWGQSFEQAQTETDQLWSQFSSVAASNPYAWLRRFFRPSEISTPCPDNRLVAGPYTKRMVANPTVNQGAATLLTSFGTAKAMGIPDHRIVFLWGGSAASEPADFLSRDQYEHSWAMDVVLEAAQALCRENREEFGLVELYSCFPCVPKMARRVLNWSHHKLSTVAGGLTFFGGPYNNYMTHATAAMTRSLREHRQTVGLLFGLGGFVTKHHALVVATHPPVNRLSSSYGVQADVDRRRGTVPVVEEAFVGSATVETYTIAYDRNGEPEHGIVLARTDKGSRLVAKIDGKDVYTLAFLTDPRRRVIGIRGTTSPREDGLLDWTF
jgi:acetyl-CoA C-acetyltransferase